MKLNTLLIVTSATTQTVNPFAVIRQEMRRTAEIVLKIGVKPNWRMTPTLEFPLPRDIVEAAKNRMRNRDEFRGVDTACWHDIMPGIWRHAFRSPEHRETEMAVAEDVVTLLRRKSRESEITYIPVALDRLSEDTLVYKVKQALADVFGFSTIAALRAWWCSYYPVYPTRDSVLVNSILEYIQHTRIYHEQDGFIEVWPCYLNTAATEFIAARDDQPWRQGVTIKACRVGYIPSVDRDTVAQKSKKFIQNYDDALEGKF